MSKDYEDRTKDELQDEARQRDLPVSGTKQEIIDRLSEADEQDKDREDRTKDELQDEARRRGLPVSGRKQELLDRLADADAEEAKDQDDDEDDEAEDDEAKDQDDEAEDGEANDEGQAKDEDDEAEDVEAKAKDEGDEDDKNKGKREESSGKDGAQGSPDRGAVRSRRKKLKPMQLAQRARRQLSELTGHSIEAISGLEPDEDHWRITLELVELARVPRASDVLGSYEVVVDADGDLLGYRRLRRYVRGAASED
jgi:hypothetical protein